MLVFPFVAKTIVRFPVLFDLCVWICIKKCIHICAYILVLPWQSLTIVSPGAFIILAKSKKRNGLSVYYKC